MKKLFCALSATGTHLFSRIGITNQKSCSNADLQNQRLMLARAFSHYNLNRVSIGVVGLNIKAISFYERLGFKKEGIQEQGYFYNGAFSDFVMMRILRSEGIFQDYY